MRTVLFAVLAVLLLNGLPADVKAAGEGVELDHQEWTFDGPFGGFDRQQLQRGFQVYREVCSSCHGLDYIAFRHLEAIG